MYSNIQAFTDVLRLTESIVTSNKMPDVLHSRMTEQKVAYVCAAQ